MEECQRAELRSDAVRTQLAWARVLARRNAAGDRRRAAALGREAQRRAEQLAMPVLIAGAIAFKGEPIGGRVRVAAAPRLRAAICFAIDDSQGAIRG